MEKNKTLEKTSSRLGRGLSALIPPSASSAHPAPPELGAGGANGVSEIALADISANPSQPRTVFNEAAIADLAASIKAHGVLQPVMVRPRGGGRYELVAGERRFRAAQEAGLSRIPAVVRSLTDEESLTVALIENIQREDLNPIEAARAYKQLMEEYHLTQGQIGEQINKSQSTISNAMRLLTLPVDMQDSISDGRMTEALGKILVGVKAPDKQQSLWQKAIEQKWTVKQMEHAVKQANQLSSGGGASPTPPSSSDNDRLHWDELERRFLQAFRMKVALNVNAAGKGTLTIKFANSEQLEDVLERLHY